MLDWRQVGSWLLGDHRLGYRWFRTPRAPEGHHRLAIDHIDRFISWRSDQKTQGSDIGGQAGLEGSQLVEFLSDELQALVEARTGRPALCFPQADQGHGLAFEVGKPVDPARLALGGSCKNRQHRIGHPTAQQTTQAVECLVQSAYVMGYRIACLRLGGMLLQGGSGNSLHDNKGPALMASDTVALLMVPRFHRRHQAYRALRREHSGAWRGALLHMHGFHIRVLNAPWVDGMG